MKKSNLFFLIFSLFLFGGTPQKKVTKVKKNAFAKKKNSNFLPSINSKIEFYFRREIRLDNYKNNNLFPKGHSELTNMLIKSVENEEIDAYTSEDFKKKITRNILKENLTIPINIESFYTPKNEKYFTGEEIKKIEIYGKYIKTVDLPQPIIENISVTLIIPAGTADMAIERNVFTLKYNDFIKLLRKKNLYLEKDGAKIMCSESFEKINKFFTYTFTTINNDFLKRTSVVENNKIAEKIFKEK